MNIFRFVWTLTPNNEQVLEDRLSDKKEALLEKELVLEEVVSLTKKLRKQASDGRQETLQLSKKVTMGVGHERVKYSNNSGLVRAFSGDQCSARLRKKATRAVIRK